MKSLPFDDTRKWGNFSFLDFLEKNNIAFKFDGVTLTFPTKADEIRARGIWYNLTGVRTIGAV